MSDQRPEWMPGEMVILEIQDGEYIDGEIDDAFRKTGLRAQIAVLEEMPMAIVETRDGVFRLADDHTGWLGRKIAALRKELGQ